MDCVCLVCVCTGLCGGTYLAPQAPSDRALSLRGLKMLLTMLMLAIPSLLNIFGLFGVVLCMYSLLAMQLFGRVAFGQHLNDDANFCTFSTAALTMFRCATGEG